MVSVFVWFTSLSMIISRSIHVAAVALFPSFLWLSFLSLCIVVCKDITLPTKVHLVKAMVFPVVLYGCESWIVKKAEHQRINAFELWCLLDCKEIQQVHPEGNQSWVFIGRTDVEAETPILWPPDAKSWLIWKDPDAGKDWRWEKKGMTEDEMAGWHHQLDGHEFGWAPGVGDGQGGLACCNSWVAKSRTRLNDWTKLNWLYCIWASALWQHSPIPPPLYISPLLKVAHLGSGSGKNVGRRSPH